LLCSFNGHSYISKQGIRYNQTVGDHLKTSVEGFTFAGNVKFNAALHFFSAHKNINADVNKTLGTELDFWCGYNHKGQVNLDFGYSHMFASEGMEVLKQPGDKSATHNWTWVMLTFKPTLFKQ